MPLDEAADLLAILRIEHRAGDVGDTAARLDQGGGAIQHFGLVLQADLQRARAHPPFGVGVAPPGAGAGAGRVDHDEVGRRPDVGERIGIAFGRAHIGIVDAGARQPLMDRRQLALVAVGRDQPALALHHRRQRQRLAAGAGAEIDHLLAGFCRREHRGELRALVLHLDRALDEILLGMDAGVAGVGAEFDAQAESATMASVRRRGGRATSAPSRGLAFSVLTRRSSGARLAIAVASATRSSPNTAAR